MGIVRGSRRRGRESRRRGRVPKSGSRRRASTPLWSGRPASNGKPENLAILTLSGLPSLDPQASCWWTRANRRLQGSFPARLDLRHPGGHPAACRPFAATEPFLPPPPAPAGGLYCASLPTPGPMGEAIGYRPDPGSRSTESHGGALEPSVLVIPGRSVVEFLADFDDAAVDDAIDLAFIPVRDPCPPDSPCNVFDIESADAVDAADLGLPFGSRSECPSTPGGRGGSRRRLASSIRPGNRAIPTIAVTPEDGPARLKVAADPPEDPTMDDRVNEILNRPRGRFPTDPKAFAEAACEGDADLLDRSRCLGTNDGTIEVPGVEPPVAPAEEATVEVRRTDRGPGDSGEIPESGGRTRSRTSSSTPRSDRPLPDRERSRSVAAASARSGRPPRRGWIPPAGRGEDHLPSGARREGRPAAELQRGARVPRPSGHRPPHRRRGDGGRPPVAGDGVRRWRGRDEVLRSRAARSMNASAIAQDRDGGPARPRESRGAPGHQAGQRPRHRQGRPQASRLQDREAREPRPRGRRCPGHPGGERPRSDYGPRAVHRPGHRHPGGRLFARGPALRARPVDPVPRRGAKRYGTSARRSSRRNHPDRAMPSDRLDRPGGRRADLPRQDTGLERTSDASTATWTSSS